MRPYIFTARNGIHILDLQQTVASLGTAYRFVVETVAGGGQILFVGTKKQAQETVADEAARARQFSVTQRWLGGTLTNFATIRNRLHYLADLEGILDHYSESAATLVGHSMGGHIASLYAGVRPSRVRRVVSLEGFGLPRVDASIAPDRLGQWLDEISKGVRETLYDSSERLARMLQHRNPRLTDERAAFIAKSWTSPVSEGGVMLRFDPWHRLVNPVLYRREEAEACWRRIVAPTLVLLAGESEYRKRLGTHDGSEELERFKTCFAHLEVHDFPALGHMMHHADPVGVAAVLSDWLHRWR